MESPVEVYFTENINVYPADAFTPDTIQGETVIDEVMGAFEAISSYGVTVVYTPRDSPMIKVYTASGDSLGAFGIKGQGPNDFYNATPVRIEIAGVGDTCVWLNDVSARMLKRLNITRSRIAGTTLVDSVINTGFGAINAALAGNRLVYELMDNDAYKLKWRDTDNPADTLHAEQMYVYPTQDFYAYYSREGVSPDGKHVVFAMGYFNQLNIVDIPSMERRAVSVGNLMKYEDCYDSEERMNKYNGYGAVACGTDNIYAIYFGTPVTDDDEPDRTTTTIHVIGYDGTLRAVHIVPDVLKALFFNSDSGKLCGIDDNDRVIQYDI